MDNGIDLKSRLLHLSLWHARTFSTCPESESTKLFSESYNV